MRIEKLLEQLGQGIQECAKKFPQFSPLSYRLGFEVVGSLPADFWRHIFEFYIIYYFPGRGKRHLCSRVSSLKLKCGSAEQTVDHLIRMFEQDLWQFKNSLNPFLKENNRRNGNENHL